MHTCIVSLSKEIARVMKISGRTKRMDSMMVDANIKKLCRLELICTCVADLVIRLKRESVEGIPESLLHYAADNDFNQVFYYARDSDYAEKCLQLLADVDTLLIFCGRRYDDWKMYQFFTRCISEQTVKEDGSRWLATHGDGTMNSSILQNPSNLEATFRSKAGEERRSYVANLEESVGENDSVITDYQFEQNTYSNSRRLSDTRQPEACRNEKCAYRLNKYAGEKANDFYAGFELSDDGKIIHACPGDIEPLSCNKPYKNGEMRVAFLSCLLRELSKQGTMPRTQREVRFCVCPIPFLHQPCENTADDGRGGRSGLRQTSQ